jgi:nicotinamide-nucleotide amidase
VSEALSAVIPPDIEVLVRRVLKRAEELGLALATAESCTGGLLASLLTDIPGQSHAFERGFVTYTNEAKHEMLGVAQDILDNDGAVSERAAIAMAEGALANSHADIAASITGYAEGAPGEPAGLVHFACARTGRPTTHRVMRFGDVGRAAVRVRALEAALGMMRDQMVAAPDANAA